MPTRTRDYNAIVSLRCLRGTQPFAQLPSTHNKAHRRRKGHASIRAAGGPRSAFCAKHAAVGRLTGPPRRMIRTESPNDSLAPAAHRLPEVGGSRTDEGEHRDDGHDAANKPPVKHSPDSPGTGPEVAAASTVRPSCAAVAGHLLLQLRGQSARSGATSGDRPASSGVVTA